MEPELGRRYTRREIHDLVGGGDLESYLPHKARRVLCGCFDREMNLAAPFEIDFGDPPEVQRYAALAAEQSSVIPVFLKDDVNSWEYCGRFRPYRTSTNLEDVARAKERRADAVGILFLEEVLDGNSAPLVPDFETAIGEAIEGRQSLIEHITRERSRNLIDAKRRLVRAMMGSLMCEACGLNSAGLPENIGDACFEVHHTRPLVDRTSPSPTRLDELALLCANCHRMIHRTKPLASTGTLRKLLRPPSR
jgi:hypothetical protein